MPAAVHPAVASSPVPALRIVALQDLSAADLQAWAALEARAAEPNAYLSPFFVLPAVRHLTPHADTLVCFVERAGAGHGELMAVAVFDKALARRQFPLPHLGAYRSLHSFLGGLLVDRSCAAEAIDALLGGIRRQMPWFLALDFGPVWTDGELARGIESAARNQASHQAAVARAVLTPAKGPDLLKDKAFASRLRDLNRRRRRLEDQGRVEWRWHRDTTLDAPVEDFLALEHMGWKGQGGTSLRAQPHHEAFFREAVRGFAAQRRALFTELCLDGKPIASCCTFIAGRMGFGFKIGWNPEFRSAAPAKLAEIELMRHAHDAFPDIEQFDSGAGPESYINELWPERRLLTHLVVPTAAAGSAALHLVDAAKRLRRSLRGTTAPTREAAHATAD